MIIQFALSCRNREPLWWLKMANDPDTMYYLLDENPTHTGSTQNEFKITQASEQGTL